MNKKILLVIIPILLSLGLFSNTKAMTFAEIKAQISAVQNQIAQLKKQLAQIQFDYSLSVSPASATVNRNSSVQTSLIAKLVSGGSKTLNFRTDPGSVPPGITVAFNPTSCTLNNTCTVSIDISASTTTQLGTWPIIVYAEDTVDHLTRSATFEVTVNTATACTHNNPTVTLTPTPQAGNARNSKVYTVNVTNNDTAGCTMSGFITSTTACPLGWICSFSNAIPLVLAPNTSSSKTLSVTSPAATVAGNYTITVQTANGTVPGFNGSFSAFYAVNSTTVAGTCSDGTTFGFCSITKPKYCYSGTLIDRCGAPYNCGCPFGQTCLISGSCQASGPTCGNNSCEAR